jgi:hypothetical protein
MFDEVKNTADVQPIATGSFKLPIHTATASYLNNHALRNMKAQKGAL